MLPLLKQLHWLPVCFQVKFQVLVMIFKALNDLGHSYLKDCFLADVPVHQLQPSGKPSAGYSTPKGGLSGTEQSLGLFHHGSCFVEWAPWRDEGNLLLGDVQEALKCLPVCQAIGGGVMNGRHLLRTGEMFLLLCSGFNWNCVFNEPGGNTWYNVLINK